MLNKNQKEFNTMLYYAGTFINYTILTLLIRSNVYSFPWWFLKCYNIEYKKTGPLSLKSIVAIKIPRKQLYWNRNRLPDEMVDFIKKQNFRDNIILTRIK